MVRTVAPAPTLDAARIEEALEHVNVPSYHIDPAGVVRWLFQKKVRPA